LQHGIARFIRIVVTDGCNEFAGIHDGPVDTELVQLRHASIPRSHVHGRLDPTLHIGLAFFHRPQPLLELARGRHQAVCVRFGVVDLALAEVQAEPFSTRLTLQQPLLVVLLRQILLEELKTLFVDVRVAVEDGALVGLRAVGGSVGGHACLRLAGGWSRATRQVNSVQISELALKFAFI
jgi:hypothetical protein